MTTFEVTKKQNIRVDGVKYVTEEHKGNIRGAGCMQCILSTSPSCTAAPCTSEARTDGREVIFVAKKAKVSA